LLADDEEVEDGEEAEMDAEMDMEDELDLESVEYDLDEEVAEEDEVVEEATKLQDKAPEVAKNENPDNKESSLTNAPKKTFVVDGQKAGIENKDGGEGSMGDNKPADNTPTDNINVEPKKA